MRNPGQDTAPATTNISNFYTGDNCFILKFRAPLRQGDDFAPVFQDSMVFNGVYFPIQIHHAFVDGMFKQTLTGTRLPLIDILKAAGYQPGSTSNPTVDVTSSPPSTNKPTNANSAASNASAATNSASGYVASSTAYDPLLGKVVGTGQCVALVQAADPAVGHTSTWAQGQRVVGSDIAPGTVIATFDANGRYTNSTDGSSHAAIYLGQNAQGMQVQDQFVLNGVKQPSAVRTISWNGNTPAAIAANRGTAFYVVTPRAPI
jgi:hypothetical protein